MSAQTDERENSTPDRIGEKAPAQISFWQERLLLTVAIIVLALDQFSKGLVVSILPSETALRDSSAEEFYEYQEYHRIKKEIRDAQTVEEEETQRKKLEPFKGKFEIIVIEGFFSIIHRTNDGAAFSILRGKNGMLAVISVIALTCLIRFRHQFEYESTIGRNSFGLLIGGIIGNMLDRIFRGSVVDFIEIFIDQRDGNRLAWPAFNVADSAIVIGVFLLFIIAWREENKEEQEKEITPDEK